MKEFFTRAEIFEQFPGEWVLVINPRTDKALNVLGGKVVCHSKDRDQVYRKAVDMKPKDFTVVYTGNIPKGSAVVL